MGHRAGAGRRSPLFGFPDQATRETRYAIHIPWVLGLIATRSLDDGDARHQRAGRAGRRAHPQRHHRLRRADEDRAARPQSDAGRGSAAFEDTRPRPRLRAAAQALRRRSRGRRRPSRSTRRPGTRCRRCAPLFWSLPAHGRPRLLLHRCCSPTFFWLASVRQLERYRWLLRVAFCRSRCRGSRSELGWFVAEFGRQPWIIDGVLPTCLGVSDLGVRQVALTICRLRAVLHGARGRRGGADDQVHQARPAAGDEQSPPARLASQSPAE